MSIIFAQLTFGIERTDSVQSHRVPDVRIGQRSYQKVRLTAHPSDLHGDAAAERFDGDSAGSTPTEDTTVLHSTPVPATSTAVDLDEVRSMLLSESDFDMPQLTLLREAVSRQQSADVRRTSQELRASVDGDGSPSQGALVRLGVALHLLGNHRDAKAYLNRTEGHPIAAFYLGHVCIALNQPEVAVTNFAAASQSGYDAVECELQRVAALRLAGQIDEAEAALKAVAAKAVSRADYSFQMGCLLADHGDNLGAIEYFERAVDMDPHHARALFWLGNESTRHGNDEDAISLYERALSRPPLHLGTLLNLGLLYEDRESYDQAAFCFRRVLEADPTNERARLYLKDIDASEGMFYDEEHVKSEQKKQQTLDRPIGDFELSVRSRNCLDRLGIVTLGDLTDITEQELMSSRNFGETSLKEIGELLVQNHLRIGERVETRKPDTMTPPADLDPEQRAAMDRPISDLNLSVRARKCMVRLNLTGIGELLVKTPDDLLSSKNFGVTSLNEIRGKLAEIGLSLRND